jgi:hypothetical protein
MLNPGIKVPFEGADWVDFELNVNGDIRHFRVGREALHDLEDAHGQVGSLIPLYRRHERRIHEVARNRAMSDTDTDRIELRRTYFK